MNYMKLVLSFSWLCVALSALHAEALAPKAPNVIRYAEIDPRTPVFVPVHPRIATTIGFPQPVGDPMGTGFVDSDSLSKLAAEGKVAQVRGEYVITFTRGDPYFTVQPMKSGELLNLNVPYQGTTVVLYFYLAENPLEAVASLIFFEKGKRPPELNATPPTLKPVDLEQATAAISGPASTKTEDNTSEQKKIRKMDMLPLRESVPATAARIEGLLRKLTIVHATKVGPELEEISSVMGLKVAISVAEEGGSIAIPRPVNDSGLYQLILLRAVRDSRLDAVGFIVLFRNTSQYELVFDVRSLAARCGAGLYQARAVDAPAKLRPGEIKPGYFVIVGAGDDRPGYLEAANDWTVSVSLVSPKLPAGEILSQNVRGKK